MTRGEANATSEQVPDEAAAVAAARAQRDVAARDRDKSADDRDQRADAHDEESAARDERAAARDDRAAKREEDAAIPDSSALSDRAAALRDREGGASDRTQSADDRKAAASDRAVAAGERAVLAVDQLTDTYRREIGLVELRREVARAQRTQQQFVVAFVDVDGLKARNDSQGHQAGDDLLAAVADALRAQVRSYDLIIRYGGDEFVCGLPDISAAEVATRFARLNESLATSQDASVTGGIVEVQESESLDDLLARADAALYAKRQQG